MNLTEDEVPANEEKRQKILKLVREAMDSQKVYQSKANRQDIAEEYTDEIIKLL